MIQKITLVLILFSFFFYSFINATDYHIGPNQSLATISEVPWTTLMAGDRVYIHWRNTPYKEKWVINRQGTATNPIEIIGVNGPNGEQAIIDGRNAITVVGVDFWNERRGVIKIGGSSIPSDGLPKFITIENLEIRSAHPNYQFTNDQGQMENYADNAASIYIEKGADIIIRNCTIHDSGNGLFSGAFNGLTENLLIEKNYFYNNGIDNSAFQHNTYTSGINTIYQYNHFGPLRTNADGNNLKDRSAGLVVRYNWIESGNRQLDLVEADNIPELINHSSYNTTHVYGNILIEPDGAGNSQIIHYGGDNGNTDDYRKGHLYLYNNTIISTRQNSTTLLRLSTNDETAEVFNNVIYSSAAGTQLALTNGDGTINLHHNWIKEGWKECHCTSTGVLNNLGNNIEGTDPLFEDYNAQDFSLKSNSVLVNNGDVIPSSLLPAHELLFEYEKHQDFKDRSIFETLDIGAYEYENPTTTGVHIYTELDGISLYPNPFTDKLIIDGNFTPYEIKIFDTLGVEVADYSGSTNPLTINFSELSSGAYFISIFNTANSKLNLYTVLKQ